MTADRIAAACGEARKLGLRAMAHAHASERARAAILAGCTTIEHGTLLDDATLESMAARGVYFDPNFLVLHNYLDNKAEVSGHWQLQRAGVRLYGKGAAAVWPARMAATPNNYRVRDGGDSPMDALASETSVAAESLGMSDRIGPLEDWEGADIVTVDGNPLDDITAVRRVVFVMRHESVV
jgi:imidazolonepropionase-like amidohydrolase